MARIIQFPPQPGAFTEIENTWFYEGARCKANCGQPDDKEKSCPAFIKKYAEDNATVERCTCLMCQHLELDQD